MAKEEDHQPMERLEFPSRALGAVAYFPLRTAGEEASAFYWPAALRHGPPANGHGVLSDLSHTTKIIGKPCAGKPHRRFERGSRGRRAAGKRLRAMTCQ